MVDAAEGSWGPPGAIPDQRGSAYYLARRGAWLTARARRQELDILSRTKS